MNRGREVCSSENDKENRIFQKRWRVIVLIAEDARNNYLQVNKIPSPIVQRRQAEGLHENVHGKALFGCTAIAGLLVQSILCPGVLAPLSKRDIAMNATGNSEIVENTENSHSPEIGVWFYANRYFNTIPNVLVDKLEAWKINTIYFAGTDINDWKNKTTRNSYFNFIQYANDKGMKVYGVTLEDPSFALMSVEELEETFRQFINLTRDLFDSYVIDVEPHAILGPDVHTFIPEYIRMSHILSRVSQDEGVRYIDTVPYWYHTVIKQIGISPGLDILASDGVNLMTYSYSSNNTLENIKKIQSEIKKPVTISIKIIPGQTAPQLKTSELSATIDEFKLQSLNFTIYEAQYILSR
jgi:hypothetical protein